MVGKPNRGAPGFRAGLRLSRGFCYTLLVFGRAANKPFGTVSNMDKGKIGVAIKDHF
jgi:hypothetical protein